jgi:peptidoglycan glycosyltransferase
MAPFDEGDDNKGGIPCGGTLSVMLAQSCDPGYGKLGVALGAATLAQQAALLGYNSAPPIDLPGEWVATPSFPPASTLSPTDDEALLAYSAIGQYDDKASALSNALVAAGIANLGRRSAAGDELFGGDDRGADHEGHVRSGAASPGIARCRPIRERQN